jgi:purine-binding chemotaxis protein CheW
MSNQEQQSMALGEAEQQEQTPTPAAEAASLEHKRQATLRARAIALAQPVSDDEEAGQIEVVTFMLGKEKYGIASRWIREVHPLRDLTPLPCTPAYVLGITHIRRRITSVLDPGAWLGLAKAEWSDQSRIIVLHAEGMEFGLAVDQIEGVQTITPTLLETGLPTQEAVGNGLVQGVTLSGLIMLDAAGMLADENLIIHEEVLIQE